MRPDQPEQEDGDKKPEGGDDDSSKLALNGAWIAIGAGVGVAIGVALDNIGIWLPIGVAVGAALSMYMTAVGKRK